MGKRYLMNQVLSRLLGPDSVEPEASELERSQGLISLHQRLEATSNKMGCCTTTGSTLLISERPTKRSQDEASLSSDSAWELAMCHTCRCM